ncbi:hypothetical protein TNCV_702921 [Trichonephila clavipes]|nr:hypothetical protein TNCV_702921 [Trichonephila clavipes]
MWTTLLERVIGKLEDARSLTSAAEELEINKSVVSHTWKSFQTICTAVRKDDVDFPKKQLQWIADKSPCK